MTTCALPLSLADIVRTGVSDLIAQYGTRLQHDHRRALNAITGCRTGAFGEVHCRCPACDEHHHHACSCGHRSCPLCQHHTTAQWLERQRARRLPVDYFMVTFTLPAGLRGVAQARPRVVYDALFVAAASTLKSFGRNGALQAELGLCAVLHTHSRKLDYHPHLHVIVPGGGIDRRRRQWKKLRGRYLFNEFALAKVFRARMLEALSQAGITLPIGLPAKWVAHCRNVGAGDEALQYLARYLYRGVIHPRNIVACDTTARTVTFRYRDSQTQQTVHRTLSIADFLWRLMLHVLPSGYRRVRDYGFLHHNAKRTLALVQLVLHVLLRPPPTRPPSLCPKCQTPMIVTVSRPPMFAT